MKSVITILIDSVFSKCLGKGVTEISSTPFIDKLAKQGIYATNVYSFGPYTDAATKGLYCGQPTLDDFGFYYCINGSKSNHFRVFKERGYETFGFYYPYYLLSEKTEQYIDHSIYISGFLYESVWNGKLKQYGDIKNKEGLTDFDYQVLEKCLDMVFQCWIKFYNNLGNQEYSNLIVKRLKEPNVGEEQGTEALCKEYNKYLINKKKYIDSVLVEGMNHALAKINDYNFDKHINIDLLKNEVYREQKSFFNEIYKKNKKLNRKNNEFDYGRFLKEGVNFLRTKQKEDLRYAINYGMLMSSTKSMIKRSFKKEWQLEASAGKQVDTLISLLKSRNSDHPFYVSLHVEEPHHNIAFFSYDSDDIDRIKEELEYLKPLVRGCGNNFSGNLMYQLSLRYVDFCVKKLFDYLSSANMLDDIVVLIVADHGSSYVFSPLRDSVTNNFYDENYHIPMIIWDNNLDSSIKGKYEGLYDSSDVFPTLMDVLGLEQEEQFKGFSMLQNTCGRDIVISEYTGPGCPDLIRKEIWITGRTKQYSVSYRVLLDSDFNEAAPVEIYDRISDPLEKHNLAFIEWRRNGELQVVDRKVKERLAEIKNNRDTIVQNFDSFKVTLEM